jgi:hypothetical protein
MSCTGEVQLGDHVGSVGVALVIIPEVLWTQAQLYHPLYRPLYHPLYRHLSPPLVQSLFRHLYHPFYHPPQLRLLAAQVTFREASVFSLRWISCNRIVMLLDI